MEEAKEMEEVKELEENEISSHKLGLTGQQTARCVAVRGTTKKRRKRRQKR